MRPPLSPLPVLLVKMLFIIISSVWKRLKNCATHKLQLVPEKTKLHREIKGKFLIHNMLLQSYPSEMLLR